ncbi:MAG: HEPN domain-containing protein [Candidatus Caldarchaeum sp.]|nr:HEPN domain-containing protein [Candidatus Caldarchaeum sp.]MDW8434597.1 HEPN domain-containing protein [Candidatus Caldarchaeum sp.]
MSDVREEALDWWHEAQHNLRQAKKNFDLEEYSVAAFLSHQAAEKALKALYITLKSRLPPKGQNLVRLGKTLEAEEVLDELKVLNPHYMVARYPNAANAVPSEIYSREIATRCLTAAEKVLEWARKRR